MKINGLVFAVALSLMLGTQPSQAGEIELDPEASVFAVVTHKAGLAARLAHNHLVVAEGYEASLKLDPSAPETTTFQFQVPSAQLKVDDPAAQKKWYPRIAELGILDEPFSEISDKDRRKIHESMVGKKQMNVEKFPSIKARLLSVADAGSEAAAGFPYAVELEVEIVGQKVTRTFAGRFDENGSKVILEAFAELRFTDFGIEPYSAMLGAVKNDDPFHIFVHLEGQPIAEESSPTDP